MCSLGGRSQVFPQRAGLFLLTIKVVNTPSSVFLLYNTTPCLCGCPWRALYPCLGLGALGRPVRTWCPLYYWDIFPLILEPQFFYWCLWNVIKLVYSLTIGKKKKKNPRSCPVLGERSWSSGWEGMLHFWQGEPGVCLPLMYNLLWILVEGGHCCSSFPFSPKERLLSMIQV